MISEHNNPLLNLNYEPAMELLGDDYYDLVKPAQFPRQILRFRNDSLLPILGLEAESVKDQDFLEAFAQFQGVRPFLALRYHGYQFGEYNAFLGDGRGFLYGQVRGIDECLYDFGTKGSGTTPYSRHADGRLTLKGGVREVLAAEALYHLGVNTSRCLSLVETGESLWRGDEPSPTRSSVMVRMSRSHIRFGTFERLRYLGRTDLIYNLLDHVIAYYYPEVGTGRDRYQAFFASLVERVAKLAAQWMAAGFCHGVLNTDNMSITGESFDYGPYAFIPTYNLSFTAAYFDYGGRYSYGEQPSICRLNLELLQAPLALVIPFPDLESILANFGQLYQSHYYSLMGNKLGFVGGDVQPLVMKTIDILQETQISYPQFFANLATGFNQGWRADSSLILENLELPRGDWENWRQLYHNMLNQLPTEAMPTIAQRLGDSNPQTILLRPVIETVWEAIALEDNWQPFYDLIKTLQSKG